MNMNIKYIIHIYIYRERERERNRDSLVPLNLLKTKRRLLYFKAQFVPRCIHFSDRFKNQSVSDGSSNKSLFDLI
jgi:hypothetical protein